MIVKVKEPQSSEWSLLRPDQVVFTYFHFAADESLTRAIIDSGITAIAYETLRDPRGSLPLLTPMSEVAGRMSIQEGARFLSGLRKAGEFSWPEFRESRLPKLPFSVEAWSARTRRKLPPGWERTCEFWT